MEAHITGRTGLACLLGSPVAHSISPMMHNEAFRLLGLDYVYLCFEADEARLPSALEGLRALRVLGFNCTMPLKTEMCRLADRLSPAAAMIGAVNTVVNENGVFTGYNTDGTGYIRSLADAGFSIRGKTMTLLGAGGAASAIAVQAALDGAAQIRIFNRRSRSWASAEALAEKISKGTACRAEAIDLEDRSALRASLSDSHLLTNATSAGMAPAVEDTPVPDASFFHPGLLVSDIIYNPRVTRLMKLAQEAGCQVQGGLSLLLYQGAEAFRLWTGKEMPLESIRGKYFRE